MVSKIVLLPSALGLVSAQPVSVPGQSPAADSGNFWKSDAASADKEPTLFWNLQPFASKERLRFWTRSLPSILRQHVRQSHWQKGILDAFLLSFNQCWFWNYHRSHIEPCCWCSCSLTLVQSWASWLDCDSHMACTRSWILYSILNFKL